MSRSSRDCPPARRAPGTPRARVPRSHPALVPGFLDRPSGVPRPRDGSVAHAPEDGQPDERTLRPLAPASKGLTADAGDWPSGRADRGTILEHPIRILRLLSECVICWQETQPGSHGADRASPEAGGLAGITADPVSHRPARI